MDDPPEHPLPSDFPHYHDGDVLVVLTANRYYQLHSQTLCLNSAYFRLVLTEDNAAQPSPAAKQACAVVRWRFEFSSVSTDGGEAEPAGMLTMMQLDDHGRFASPSSIPTLVPPNPYNPFSTSISTSSPTLLDAYDALFRCFYHLPHSLAAYDLDDLTIATHYLTTLATALDSVPAISQTVENALLSHNQALFRAIATDPIFWADLACHARCALVFKEAITHAVGQWHALPAASAASLPPPTRALCQHKASALATLKRAVEMRLLGFYPAHLQRNAGTNTTPGGTVTRLSGTPTRSAAFAADILAWMALNLFRMWLGQQIAGDGGHAGPDAGAELYRCIAAGGEAYIGHDVVEAFARYFPMSARSRCLFVGELAVIKEAVAGKVAGLVESRCLLDVGKWPVKHLTCVEVADEELPWQAG